MKILVDMNLSPRWAHFFLQNGLEAVHWSEIGLTNAPDIEIMNYAVVNGYAVFTHDLDLGVYLQRAAQKNRALFKFE
jgi:predicted nuclease of predicted toxin-antitoxin system